uniref:Uncharacterized protein n=2 Tax=Rhizophora mucronata TaxID=61149 RepID=A0A2P2MAM2_RHIMU
MMCPTSVPEGVFGLFIRVGSTLHS